MSDLERLSAHLTALYAAGWTWQAIGDTAGGVSRESVRQLAAGRRPNALGSTVAALLAVTVDTPKVGRHRAHRGTRTMHAAVCPRCGDPYEWTAGRKTPKFCSRRCAGKSRIGIPGNGGSVGNFWSDAALIAQLRAAAVDGRVTVCRYRAWRDEDPAHRATASTFLVRFGSWANAARAAGLECGDKPAGFGIKQFATEEMLYTLAQKGLVSIAEYEAGKQPGEPSAVLFRKRFGSWSAALYAAGLVDA